MIVFTAVVPHSPLLLPTIGREYEKKLAGTLSAYKTLRKNLHAARVDTLVIISPHGTTLDNAAVLNLHEDYEGDLREFGDLTTKPYYKSDLATIDQLQRTARKKSLPITLLSTHTVDYGITVPLALLTPAAATRLVPITPGRFDTKHHFTLGEVLREPLVASKKRIGIIMSTDLSHRLTTDAPEGFSPAGRKFDDTVRESFETNNLSRLLRVSSATITEAKQCGFRGIVLGTGMLSGMSVTPRVLAYEAPFGVGYLTISFSF